MSSGPIGREGKSHAQGEGPLRERRSEWAESGVYNGVLDKPLVCVRSELLCGREGAFVWERRLSAGEKLLSREFDDQFRERLVLWMVFVVVWSPVHSSSCERWRRSRRFRRRVRVCEGDTCRQDTSQPTEPQGSSFSFSFGVLGCVCVCVRPRLESRISLSCPCVAHAEVDLLLHSLLFL